MNILTDQLPEAVEIDGNIYELNTDFRTGIEIMLVFEDPELTPHEQMLVMLTLLYKEMPSDLEEACRLAVKFLNCGEEEDREGSGQSVDRLYSFEKDARYIYSAIKQSHNVDLESVSYLHWWKFNYMFLDLAKECFFLQLINLRKKKLTGKLTKEEQEYCNTIREIIELPCYVSSAEKEKENEFMRLLNLECQV